MAKLCGDRLFSQRAVVVFTNFLGCGFCLFVGLVWGFWKRKNNSVLVSSEVLPVQHPPEPTGLC